MWSTDTLWSFKNSEKVYGSPLLDESIRLSRGEPPRLPALIDELSAMTYRAAAGASGGGRARLPAEKEAVSELEAGEQAAEMDIGADGSGAEAADEEECATADAAAQAALREAAQKALAAADAAMQKAAEQNAVHSPAKAAEQAVTLQATATVSQIPMTGPPPAMELLGGEVNANGMP